MKDEGYLVKKPVEGYRKNFIKEGGISECWGFLFFLPLISQPSGLPPKWEKCRKEA